VGAAETQPDLRVRVGTQLRRMADQAAGARRRMEGSANAVALTFDDGPDPTYTPHVLDVLDSLGVPATFFVVGEKATEHPELLRRMVAQGCAVGSHSNSHPDPDALSHRELVAEYRAGAAAVADAIGAPATRFRPPKGRIGRRGAAAIRQARLSPWLWSVDPDDWRPSTTVDDIVGCAERAVAGDIVLLHDGMSTPIAPEAADRSTTIAAIEPLVGRLRERGIDLVALP
jgi:peptidoglycan/xylan/chitin deacetylase (PgdA/CDA1 family)